MSTNDNIQRKEQKNAQPKNKPTRALSDVNDNNNIVFYSNKKGSAEKRVQSIPQVPENKTNAVQRNMPKKSPPKKAAPKKTVSKRKRKLSGKHKAINTVVIILSIIMILAGSGFLVAYTYFHRINYQAIDTEHEASSVIPIKPADKTKIDPYQGTLLDAPDVLNVMLFGEDRRSGSDVGNSDTMVLFSIDTRHRKMKMLSFLRDTYVDIPGYESNRINASYTLGGASLAVSTIQKNYGIKIDRYAVVDFKSFRQIIDTLGGIDIDLTSDEIDYINWQSWINQQDEYKNAEGDYKEYVRESLKYVWQTSVPENMKPINKNGIKFTVKKSGEEPVAKVHLNGKEALWHARNRGEDGICAGSDFTRTERQRNVLGVIINDLKKADIPTVMSVIYEIGPLITTNLKTSEITSLASNISTYLTYDIVSESAPLLSELGLTYSFSDPYENPVYIGGALSSVIVINDWNDFRKSIAEFIYEEQVVLH